MKTLKKSVFKIKNRFQFYVAHIGLAIGLFASVFSIIIYSEFNVLKTINEDVFGDNTIVLQKKVTKLTSLGINSTEFTDIEIESIKNESSVSDLGIFQSANYEVGISEQPGTGLPHFYANMFLQSIPDQFINNVDIIEWSWNENKQILPIILPKNFLTLVNYGIAPSQGLPQVSEDFVKSIQLKIHLIGPSKRGSVIGRVVGFSSQINSVLVPSNFIKLSNKRYGSFDKQNVNRVVIKLKNNDLTGLNNLIEIYHLDLAEQSLNISRLKGYLNYVIVLIFVLSLLIFIIALLSIIQYGQMQIIHFEKEINISIKLGYSIAAIKRIVIVNNLKAIIIISTLSILSNIIIKFLLVNPVLSENGLVHNHLSIIYGLIFVIVLIVISFLLIHASAKQTILKIAKIN